MVSVTHYLVLALLLFALGILGVVSRRNIFIVFMSVELMLNAANLALIALGRHFQSLDGSVMAMMVIGVAAAEASLFFAIVLLLFRQKKSVDADLFTFLKRQDFR